MELHPSVVQKFCKLQGELLSALVRDQPNVRLPEDIRDLPVRGKVNADNTVWEFKRHGLGFTFEEERGGRVVSMHDCLPHSDVICSWRLLLYLESLGGRELQQDLIAAGLRSAATRGIVRLIGPDRFQLLQPE